MNSKIEQLVAGNRVEIVQSATFVSSRSSNDKVGARAIPSYSTKPQPLRNCTTDCHDK